jgi:hypothetical protein
MIARKRPPLHGLPQQMPEHVAGLRSTSESSGAAGGTSHLDKLVSI